MERGWNQNKIKMTIYILSILLILSLAALTVTAVQKGWFSPSSTTVTVPDNQITTGRLQKSVGKTVGFRQDERKNVGHSMPSISTYEEKKAILLTARKRTTSLELSSRNPENNIPFSVQNMFPGDSVTENYSVKVSCKNSVTLHFHADIRPGYEKLAEVLQVKIQSSAGNISYEGLMRDMPESLSCKLNKTQEVDYEITAWLDTSVGNEYQDQELIADFHWWLEDVKSESGGSSGSHRPSQNEPGSSSETDETIDLINGVRTGDAARPFLWLLLIVFCIGCLIWIIRKGKEDK